MRNTKSAFFTDGSRRIAFLDKAGISIFDSQKGTSLLTLSQSKDIKECIQLATSADGIFLAALTKDSSVFVWNVHHNQVIATLKNPIYDDPVVGLQCNGNTLIKMHRNYVVSYFMDKMNEPSRKIHCGIDEGITCFNNVPNCHFFAVGSKLGRVYFVDGHSGVIKTIVPVSSNEIIRILPILEPTNVIVASLDGKVAICSPTHSSPLKFLRSASVIPLNNLFASGKRKLFGTMTVDGTIEGWHLETVEKKFGITGHSNIDCFGFSSGKLLMISTAGRVLWFDLNKRNFGNDVYLTKSKFLRIIKSLDYETLVECTRCGKLMWINCLTSDPNGIMSCLDCKEAREVFKKKDDDDDYD